jgi:hypothetical protein
MPLFVHYALLNVVLGCGHHAIVVHMIREARFNADEALRAACNIGSFDIADMILAIHRVNLGDALRYACREGNFRMAQRMLGCCATNVNDGLRAACSYNRILTATLMIENGATDYAAAAANSTGILRDALHRKLGHDPGYVPAAMIPAVYSMQGGADYWDAALCYVCTHGDMDAVEFIIGKGATNWNVALTRACIGGHARVASTLIDHGATNLDEALEAAVMCDHAEVAALLINRGANAPMHAYVARVWGGPAVRRLFGTEAQIARPAWQSWCVVA